MHSKPIGFKTLTTSIRREFKKQDFDVKIRTKTENSLGENEFYIMAYYDAEDDSEHETPIEVVIHHNFTDADYFERLQITEFLIQIFDAVVHEFKHREQSIKRDYKVYSSHEPYPYHVYLADPDEIDAYALSIAIELLRVLPRERAKRYLSRIRILAKMRNRGMTYSSPTLQSYMAHYGMCDLTKKLAKKIYFHLDELDSKHIFI
jgi:hypothetical protein